MAKTVGDNAGLTETWASGLIKRVCAGRLGVNRVIAAYEGSALALCAGPEGLKIEAVKVVRAKLSVKVMAHDFTKVVEVIANMMLADHQLTSAALIPYLSCILKQLTPSLASKVGLPSII